ncbi:MAG TPA: VWA domain-containing protein [Micromonosporaceae bacterium]
MDDAQVTRALLTFARTLREAGVDATPERVQAMFAAAGSLGAHRPDGVYWAGRLTLCAEPEDLPVYDAAFAACFGDRVAHRPTAPTRPAATRLTTVFTTDGGTAAGPRDRSPAVVQATASDTELLRHRDVAALSPVERAELRRLLALLAPATAPRLTRRYRPAPRGDVDPARTVRRMLRHVGEPARPVYRRHRARPRRLVLLLDVSGSMALYADALLRFAHAAVRRRPASTEVFTIGTRITRITRPLRHRDPDAALRDAGRAIPDWQGGTRLGEALKAFLDRWGQRGTARGAVVVLCSDGWERGTADLLAAQVARLSRLAYRVVWVNPHRGKPGYAPLARGMAAALPYLDDFVAGHSLAALEELVEVISRA